jgi:hypothetical protein
LTSDRRGQEDRAPALRKKAIVNGRVERLGPLAGIIAVVLFVVGVFLSEGMTNPPDDDAAAQAFLDYYQDEEGGILVAGWVFQLGAVFFLWFLGSLRVRLLAAEGRVGRLTATAFAAGIVTATCALLLPASDMAGALSKDEITPDGAVVFNNLGDMFFLGAEFASAVFLAAAGLIILSSRMLPRWLGWVSLVFALWLLIAPIGWAALLFGVPLWILVVSVLLYLRPAVAEPAPAA